MAITAAKPKTTPDAALQFERADFGAMAPSRCAKCEKPLSGSYWGVNGQAVCDGCREALARLLEPGGGFGRFVRASVFGALGRLAGTLVYCAVLAFTGYEFSLLAILVGWLVGAGVRAGARGRGGFAYQALAVVLTYSAIVSAYIPMMVSELREHAPAHATAATPGDAAAPRPDHVAPAAVAPDATARPDETDLPRPLAMALAYVLLFAFACALPFLAGASNLLGLLIIAIGLHQAWAMNRRMQLDVTGPHAIAASHA